MIAGIDSFKDDNLQFLHRLLANNVDAQATEFRMMPHGFLSYNLPMGKGMKEAIDCVGKVFLIINDLI